MRKTNSAKAVAVLSALALWAGASRSALASVSFSGTDSAGNAISATATFGLSGGDLTLTLVNTGAAASDPVDTLTALFFNLNLASGVTATPYSATTPTLLNPVAGETLGGGWAFNSSGNGATGIGVWGPNNQFFTANQAPNSKNEPDGVAYGIVNGLATPHNQQFDNNSFADNSVTFHWHVTGGTVDLSAIQVTAFQYGTQAGQDSYTPVPEPTTMIAGALLLLPFGASTLRILRRNRTA
jgi:hypothetical protein